MRATIRSKTTTGNEDFTDLTIRNERTNERASDSLTPPRFASTRTHLSMSNALFGGSSALRGDARAYGGGDWSRAAGSASRQPIAAAVTSVAANVACRHQHPAGCHVNLMPENKTNSWPPSVAAVVPPPVARAAGRSVNERS